MEVHKNFLSPLVAALSHNIAQLLPEDLDISYFCNSGAEAVEGAVKLAYKYHGGQRQHILQQLQRNLRHQTREPHPLWPESGRHRDGLPGHDS